MGFGQTLTDIAGNMAQDAHDGMLLSPSEVSDNANSSVKPWLQAMQKSFAKTTFNSAGVYDSGTLGLTMSDYTNAPASGATGLPYYTIQYTNVTDNSLTDYATLLMHYTIDNNAISDHGKYINDLVKQLETLMNKSSFSEITDSNANGLIDLNDLVDGISSYDDFAQKNTMSAVLYEINYLFNEVFETYTEATLGEDGAIVAEAVLPTDYAFTSDQIARLNFLGTLGTSATAWNSSASLQVLAEYVTKVLTLQTKDQAVITAYNTQQQEVQAQIADKETLINANTNQINSELQPQLDADTLAKTAAETQLNNTNTSITTNVGYIQTANNLISDYNTLIAGYDADLSIIDDNEANYPDIIADYEAQIDTCDDDIATYEGLIADADETAPDYQENIDSYNAQITTLNNQKQTYQAQIDSYQEYLDNAPTQRASLQALKTSRLNDIQGQNDLISGYSLTLYGADGVADATGGLYGDKYLYEAQIATLATNIATNTSAIESMEAQNSGYQTEINTLNASIADFPARIAAWSARLALIENLTNDDSYSDFEGFIAQPNADDLEGFNTYMLSLNNLANNLVQMATEPSVSTINALIVDFNSYLDTNGNLFIDLRDQTIDGLKGNALFGLSYLLLCDYKNSTTISDNGLIGTFTAEAEAKIRSSFFGVFSMMTLYSCLGLMMQNTETTQEKNKEALEAQTKNDEAKQWSKANSRRQNRKSNDNE